MRCTPCATPASETRQSTTATSSRVCNLVAPPGESWWIIHHVAHSMYLPHVKKMTSSTKLEVYNVLYCRQRRTEPRPQLTPRKNFVKFGRLVFEIWQQTDRQTHTDEITNPAYTSGRGYVSEIFALLSSHAQWMKADLKELYFMRGYITQTFHNNGWS